MQKYALHNRRALCEVGVFCLVVAVLLAANVARGGEPEARPAAGEPGRFAGVVERAEAYANEALAHLRYDRKEFHRLIGEILAGDDAPGESGEDAVEAVALVNAAWRRAEALVRARDALFAQYRNEAEDGGASAGTRIAWSMIRLGGADPEARIDLGSFRHDADGAEIRVRFRGEDVLIRMDGTDDRRRVRAVIDGFHFNTGWSVLLQKPIGWMAVMAARFRAAGISPDSHPRWEIMEAPEGLIALAGTDAATGFTVPEAAFFGGAVRRVEAIPERGDSLGLKEEFIAAAEALHRGVLADGSIPEPLRTALAPVLEGTYRTIDPRDYFDGDFCRRLVEANYLEAHVNPLPPERAAELARYRAALARLEAGIDRFMVELGEEGRLIAVARPDDDDGSVREPETGETLSRYAWRWERGDSTVFHSPLPARYLYALSAAEIFPGRHAARPVGVPARTEVWHALLGRLAAYDDSAKRAEGDREQWLRAVILDAHGRRDPDAGPLGWDFPLFVPVRDDQGDPALVATERGVVPGPDFSGIGDAPLRRAAQDGWLDNAAAVLASPGELNLVYRLFFRYCSDSPLPELPNLVGSHLALSDTHQTVYQTLDRRWAGRLIGDCDDMAEFFQNLAVRQGRLAHVMQLPAHAAAGWLEETPEGGHAFIVLQTGPALRFAAGDKVAAVEKAYRHFEKDVGESRFISSAVPVMLRFADEDTRTSFVLSARIYWDAAYAERMTAVQEHWHLHTFSAAIETMEAMVAGGDRDPANLKELASLYEQVGAFGKAAALREEELAGAGEDALAALSTLLEMANLHARARDGGAALEALERMRGRFEALRAADPPLYARALPYRSGWAALYARLGVPERAWALVRHDVAAASENRWRVPEPLLRTLTTMYERLAMRREREAEGAGEGDAEEARRVRLAVRNALSHAFGKGYFREDDSFNKIASRYFWLGRYGVAAAGRDAGLEALCLDGPYPSAPRDHAARKEDLSEEDWEWFRIMPRLYLGLGLEMLDRDEHPELYDPAGAKRVLDGVLRAAGKGEASGMSRLLGREAAMQGALALSFIDNDLDAFRRVMDQVRGRDYSSLYDDAAVLFGSYCGLAPLSAFGEWAEAFREYFPGRQNYFKAAYRMLHKGHFDHAIRFARASAGFFPDMPLLVAEADALEGYAETLRALWLGRGWDDREWACNNSTHRIPYIPSTLTTRFDNARHQSNVQNRHGRSLPRGTRHFLGRSEINLQKAHMDYQ